MQNCIKKKAFASSTERVLGVVRRLHRGFKEERRALSRRFDGSNASPIIAGA
jgi:hypothetical protein